MTERTVLLNLAKDLQSRYPNLYAYAMEVRRASLVRGASGELVDAPVPSTSALYERARINAFADGGYLRNAHGHFRGGKGA